METPERISRGFGKSEDGVELRTAEDEDLDGVDKRKHRSGRSRKSANGDDVDAYETVGRRRSESRKRSSGRGLSRADSDEDDYEGRRDVRAKQMKKKPEESSLERLSNWYQDGELENKQAVVDSRGNARGEDSDKKKTTSKAPEHESSRTGSKSREDRVHDLDEKNMDADSRYLDRKDSREKGHSASEIVRSSRRRWDEPDSSAALDDRDYGDSRSRKDSDSKYDREKYVSSNNEMGSSKSKNSDFNREKVLKADTREERRRSKTKSEAVDEDSRGSPVPREERFGRDRADKHSRQHKNSNGDEDGNVWNRSSSPVRNSRRQQESLPSEADYERAGDIRRKDLDRDGNKEEKSKSRDENWGEKKREWESSKDNWKRRQSSNSERESNHHRSRDWDGRHGHERAENERPHSRSRSDAVKTSSNYGISSDDYDVIEIQTKPLDYVRAGQQSDANDDGWSYTRDERVRKPDLHGSATTFDTSKDKHLDDSVSAEESNMWRDDLDDHGAKGRGFKDSASGRNSSGQVSSTASQSLGSHEQGCAGRSAHQGVKVSRVGRGGRIRSGRENQPVGIPLPIMGGPFGPIGMPPPGPMQGLGPGMSPAPCPPISPGVFMSPFSAPVVWPGGRGVEMNLLGVPPALPLVPTGASAPRFPANICPPSNPAFFNQPGPGRGMPQCIPASGFNSAVPLLRGTPDKSSGGWVPPRSNGHPGKAPSRGEQNDYSQNFVDTGMRPQNFIRELELTNVVEDYPKLRELIQKKDEIVAKSASVPMYFNCDLKEFELSPEFFGTKFDVILVDPPWEEYVQRAPGVADHMDYWSFEEILNLKIEAIADTPSFIFLWVGDGVGLEQGRQCLKKWGFRRCEDICWVKTNKSNAAPGLRHDSHTLFQHSKEHCLMGIKGTVRRSTDGHIIHANIDTDVIIAEEPPYGSTQKPEDMYKIIEHFALGRRRLELFGEEHNIRAGWLTLGKELSTSNFNSEAYVKNFCGKDGKVWVGGAGRNPPPEASHLVITTPDIEALRPKSPMKNPQQQPASIPLTANRRAAVNSPQNQGLLVANLEASGSNPSTPAPWTSQLESLRRDTPNPSSEEKGFDMNAFNVSVNAEFSEPLRPVNLS